MPALKRHKTDYPEVYFVWGKSAKGKPEKIFYIRYYRNGKRVEEKAGRQYRDDMTAARASGIRAKKMEGELASNREERRKAEEAKAEEKARLQAEEDAEKNRWTIQRLWDAYTEIQPNTMRSKIDRSRFNKYIKKEFGHKEPKDLLPLDFDRLRLKMLKDKKPSTVKSVLEFASRIINFGSRQEFCEPLRFKIRKPKISNVKMEDLTPDQLSSLLKVLDEEENVQVANLMRLVLYTGIRRGEAFRLQWNHVDFQRGFITLVDTKGGTDQRIPLNDAARAVLESHPRINDYVFPGRSGQRRDIHKLTREIADKAGLPKTFRPLHGLRHYFASSLASSGEVDMYVLQRLLTHKDSRMTMRYAHLRDETLKNGSNVMGRLVKEIKESKKKEEAENEAAS
jgi:integrase